VTLSGGSSATTTADANGNYSFTGLSNGSYIVAPTKGGLTFSPASQSVTLNGASNTSVNFTASAPLQSINISASSASIIKGSTAQFTALGTLTDGTTQDLTSSAAWSSSNPTVASMTAGGVSTGVGTGSSVITAIQNGITSNSFTLTVTPGTVTLQSITINAPNSSIAKGTTEQLTAAGTFSDGSTENLTNSVTWQSSSPAATIAPGGLLAGAAVGASNITATQNGVTSNIFALAVTAATLTSITINGPNASLAKGTTEQFTATGIFSDGSTQNLTNSATWSSSNIAATTLNAGLASAVGTGSSNITAAQSGVTSNTFVLTVTAATLQSIAVSASSSSIAKGTSVQFIATGTFSDGSIQNLTNSATWASSSPATVSINAAGLATGTGMGSSNITTSQNGITSNSFALTVTAATLQSIRISANTSSIAKGTSVQFTATGTFSDGSTQNLTNAATWTSSSQGAVNISSTGLATGAAVGSSNITASQNGITSNAFALAVTAANLQSITISANTSSIAKGTSVQFTATGIFSDGSSQSLTSTATWTSFSPATVNISATGLATGVATGSSNITASQNGITSNTVPLGVTASTLQSITISANSSSIAKGTSVQFTATGTFSDGSTQNLTNTATWASSNTATVNTSAAGLATGAAIGSVNITASQNGVTSAAFALSVTAASLQSITVSAASSSIAKGTSIQLTATGTFSDGSTQNLTNTATWASASPATVNVSPTGIAMGAALGSSNITATQNGITSNGFALNVTAATLQSIAISADSASIATGTGVQFTATGTFSDGSTQNLTNTATWVSFNPATVNMSSKGLATGVAVGSSNITATQVGVISNSFALSVTAATLRLIALSASSSSIAKGTTLQFTATGTFSDGSTQDLTHTATWSSSSPATININTFALATGVAIGSSNITATQSGITSSSFALTVSAATLQSLSIGANSSSIAMGTSIQFTAIGTFSDGSTQNLTSTATWVSSSAETVNISDAGLATGAAIGSSNITASQNGVTSNTFALSVTAATLQSITISANGSSIAKGTSVQFTATGTFSDGSTQNLATSTTWASSSPATVNINSMGLATGAATGSSNITATQNGITSNTFALTVTAAILQSITVSANSSLIAKGTSIQFTATGTFTDGSTQNLTSTATWTSSSPVTVNVSTAGLASGTAIGSSNIIATQNGITSNSFALTVTAATLQAITISSPKTSMAKGTSVQFTATGTFSDGSTQNLTNTATWASSSQTSVNINSTGLATGAAIGLSNITATQNGISSNSIALTVTAATLQSITISAGSSSIAKSTSVQFTATGTFSDGSTQNLTNTATWANSSPSAVNLDATGLATGAAIGSSNITATQNGITSNSFALVVTAATLQSINVSASSSSIAKGTTVQFTATGTFSDGSTQDLTKTANWASSSPTTVNIGSTGLATGSSIGSSNITATQSGINSNGFTLTVAAPALQSINVTAPNTSLGIGLTEQFTATGRFSDGSTQNLMNTVNWASSTPANASISSSGLATGLASGTTNITASQNGINSNGFALTVTAVISGTLTIAGAGATVNLNGSASSTTTADATGNYSFSGILNGSYTVTPTKSGVTFSPVNQSVTINGASNTAVNFTATVQTWTISGTLKPASDTAGATLTLSGAPIATTTAAADGTYSFTGIANGTYTVTPTKTGYTFNPVNQQITVSNASKTGINFATVPVLSTSPGSFTFSNITVGTTSALQSGTLSASGGSVTVTNDTLTGAGFAVSGITFPLTLSPGQSQGLSVSFSPLATGSVSGSLSFTSNASNTPPAITLSGTGAGLGLSPMTVNFGSVPDGSTSPQTATLSAAGGPVTVTAANLSGAAFSISGLPALPFTIAAGQSQTFSVTFAPMPGSPGPASGSVAFLTGLNNVTQTLSGMGTSNVSLTWTASTTPNVTYNVYRCSISASACDPSQPANFGSPLATQIAATSYADLTASSGVTYYYALTAVDSSNNESGLSLVASAVIP